MTTLAALTTDTYQFLQGRARYDRPEHDTLANAIGSSTEKQITMTTPNLWKRGSIAEFPDGELVLFQQDHPTSGPVNVVRGYEGTTPAASHATTEVVWRNPRFARWQVEDAITKVVRLELWPHVWTWHKNQLAWDPLTDTYPLPDHVVDVVRIYQWNIDETSGREAPIDRDWWEVHQHVDATVAASGNVLYLRNVHSDVHPVFYVAKRRPDMADLPNLDDRIADIIPVGAAAKLGATPAIQVRTNPARTTRNQAEEGGEGRDYRLFTTEFLRLRGEVRRQLDLEVPIDRVFRRRRRVTTWRG